MYEVAFVGSPIRSPGVVSDLRKEISIDCTVRWGFLVVAQHLFHVAISRPVFYRSDLLQGHVARLDRQ